MLEPDLREPGMGLLKGSRQCGADRKRVVASAMEFELVATSFCTHVQQVSGTPSTGCDVRVYRAIDRRFANTGAPRVPCTKLRVSVRAAPRMEQVPCRFPHLVCTSRPCLTATVANRRVSCRAKPGESKRTGVRNHDRGDTHSRDVIWARRTGRLCLTS